MSEELDPLGSIKKNWVPLALLGVGLVLAQAVAAIGAQAGGNWLLWVPPVALGLAMVPWALGFPKGGRMMSLIAAGLTMTIAVLGLPTVGVLFVPSGVLAVVAGWIGLRRTQSRDSR